MRRIELARSGGVNAAVKNIRKKNIAPFLAGGERWRWRWRRWRERSAAGLHGCGMLRSGRSLREPPKRARPQVSGGVKRRSHWSREMNYSRREVPTMWTIISWQSTCTYTRTGRDGRPAEPMPGTSRLPRTNYRDMAVAAARHCTYARHLALTTETCPLFFGLRSFFCAGCRKPPAHAQVEVRFAV